MKTIGEKLDVLASRHGDVEIARDEESLSSRARDWWMRSLLLKRRGEGRMPAAVLRARASPQGCAATAEAAASPDLGTGSVATLVATATESLVIEGASRYTLLGPVATTLPPEPGASLLTT